MNENKLVEVELKLRLGKGALFVCQWHQLTMALIGVCDVTAARVPESGSVVHEGSGEGSPCNVHNIPDDLSVGTTESLPKNYSSKNGCEQTSDHSSSDDDEPMTKKHRFNDLDFPIECPPNLSKRQQKKYIKKMLWETKWKPLKRAKEREKLRQKKLEARLNNETLGPSRKALKQSTMAASNCKLRVVLDFSFDDLMSEKDVGKCTKQLNHCYCMNRRAANPLQLHVAGLREGGASQRHLARNSYQNWDVHFHEKSYLELFPKEELVYLTSDSDNVLAALDHSKVYIIGALVDHNQHKGKTLAVAEEQGIGHAQLPITDFVKMNSRKVLTIDHVFQILIYHTEGLSWKEAFLRVLPQRKGAVEIVDITS